MRPFSWLRILIDALDPLPVPLSGDYELPSPGYWLKNKVIDNLVVNKETLNVLLNDDPKVWKTTVADTNSMDTFFDYKHTVVLIAGANELDHQRILDWLIPGDIVVYEPDEGGTIIHAIKEINIDRTKGRTWKTHGLNPLITWNDPFTLFDRNIKWVCILVSYTDNPI